MWGALAETINSTLGIVVEVWDNYKWLIMIAGVGIIIWLTSKIELKP